MLNITITEQTPDNMLRAIRAACKELLGDTTAAAGAEAHKAVEIIGAPAVVQALTAEQPDLPDAVQAVPGVDIPGPTDMLAPADADPSVERDSTGAEWNPELHASTKTKNADGTWKKRRGAGKADDVTVLTADGLPTPEMVQKVLDKADAAPSLPPLPPAPPAAPLVTMNDIYALISGGKCVLNDVIAAAQAMGFADVGAFSRDATPGQRARLLQELTA